MTNAFPTITAALEKNNGNRVTRFLNAVTEITSAYDDGSISNVSYKENKEIINRCLEKAWKDGFQQPFYLDKLWAGREDNRHFRLGEDMDDIYYSTPQLHTIGSVGKKVGKITSDLDAKHYGMAFLLEIAPVAKMIETLKTMIVKRVAKAPEDVKAKYLAPRAAGSATALVQQALVTLTEETYEEVKATILHGMNNRLVNYFKICEKAKAEGKKTPSPYDAFCRGKDMPDHKSFHVVSIVVDDHGILSADKDAKFLKAATKQADFIRNQFIIKNLKKLDAIVDAKGNMCTVEIVGQTIDMNGLTGTLKITFLDGSNFFVKNSVVWSTSVRGKDFYRFPLTFHMVKMPDGSAMKSPSEENMNTVFVGKI